MVEEFTSLVKRLAADAWRTRHRRCLVLAGPHSWCVELAATLTERLRDQPIWVGDPSSAPSGFQVVANRLARGLLGRQSLCVVVDCWDGADPNIIGAVSGIVEGGGLLVLLRRPWGEDAMGSQQRLRLTVLPFEPEEVSLHFTHRFWRHIAASPGTAVLDSERALVIDSEEPQEAEPAERFVHDVAKTPDQLDALAAIMKVAQGRRRRPIVLTSDRGRGKSSVLGLAAGELLRDRGGRILLIAPSRAAVSPVFEHAQRVWHHGTWSSDRLGSEDRHLRLCVPSELVGELPDAELVLVDEAAALPVALLRRVLDRYPRVVFATTVHGYEGTGRGFSIRFRQYLDKRTPNWRSLTMKEPIRWAPGCPVETAVFSALALDGKPAHIGVDDAERNEPIQYIPVARERLAIDDSILGQVFGILVAAHYRTSPADLQRMMDAPNLQVFAALRGETVLGAALVATEGGLPSKLSRDIFLGRRRPLGHLLPETLEAYTGLAGASELTAWRVVRVAVHPDAQEQGTGSALIERINGFAEEAGVDYVGAAFGATARLLSFWREADYGLSRLGVKRGSSSGLYSAVMLKGLSSRGDEFVTLARGRFVRGIAGNLSGPWQSLEIEVVEALLEHYSEGEGEAAGLSRLDLMDVAGFASGARPFEVVFDGVLRFCRSLLGQSGPLLSLPQDERVGLVRLMLQGWSWQAVAEETSVDGRSGVLRLVSSAVRRLLMDGDDEMARELLETFESSPN